MGLIDEEHRTGGRENICSHWEYSSGKEALSGGGGSPCCRSSSCFADRWLNPEGGSLGNLISSSELPPTLNADMELTRSVEAESTGAGIVDHFDFRYSAK